jgi:hypothetical protein
MVVRWHPEIQWQSYSKKYKSYKIEANDIGIQVSKAVLQLGVGCHAMAYFLFRSVTNTTKITNGHKRPQSPHCLRIPIKQKTETSTLPHKRNFYRLPAAFLPPNNRHFHPQPSIPAISFTTQNPSLNQVSFQTKQALLKSTTLKN